MKKIRILSLILSVVMMLTVVLPAGVFATEIDEPAVENTVVEPVSNEAPAEPPVQQEAEPAQPAEPQPEVQQGTVQEQTTVPAQQEEPAQPTEEQLAAQTQQEEPAQPTEEQLAAQTQQEEPVQPTEEQPVAQTQQEEPAQPTEEQPAAQTQQEEPAQPTEEQPAAQTQQEEPVQSTEEQPATQKTQQEEPAQSTEDQPAAQTQQEEPAQPEDQPAAQTQQEETNQPVEEQPSEISADDDQQETIPEVNPETPAVDEAGGSAAEVKATEEQLFEHGYVRVNSGTVVYAGASKQEEKGSFSGSAIVYATMSAHASNEDYSWLKIVFDTADAKRQNADLPTGYVQFKDVNVLSDETAEQLQQNLLKDTTTRKYQNNPLPLVVFLTKSAENVISSNIGETKEEKKRIQLNAAQTNVSFEITKHPESIEAEVGETIRFTVEATGDGLKYQWQNSRNKTTWTNSSLEGNKTATITISVTEARYPFYWRCVVTDTSGNTLESNDAQILKPIVFEITKHPESVEAEVGALIQFAVEATGEGLTYQWQNSRNKTTWNNSSLTGNKTATITIPVTEARYPFYWRCVVADAFGNTLESNDAQILKPIVFAITKHPESVEAEAGETIQFTVEATGKGLTYQWQNSRDKATWTNSSLTGNKTATIMIPVTEARYPFYWRCVVTDASGNTLESNEAKIHKPIPIVFEITKHPESIEAEVDETIQFTIEATGKGLTYQWQNSLNKVTWTNSNLTGNQTATIIIPVTEDMYSFYWRCIVTDASENTLESNDVKIYNPNPIVFEITKHPESIEAEVGELIQFTVEATGEGLTYQWQNSQNKTKWNNSGLTGNKTATITIPVTEARYLFYWRCVVTDASGNTLESNDAQILKPIVFEITKHPESIEAEVGALIQFSVEATGESLTFQWQNSLNKTTWANSGLTGNKTATITIPVTEARYPFYWRCVVTDASGEVLYSNEAKINKPILDIIVDDCVYQKQPDNSLTLVTYSGLADAILIPQIIEGMTVTEIDSNAFAGKNILVYRQSDEGTCLIYTYTGAASTLTIPRTYEGLLVTRVGESAFEGNTALTSISLPNSIQSIGARAFKNCINLSTMTNHD